MASIISVRQDGLCFWFSMQEPEYRGNSLFNQLAIRSGESEFSLLLELLINCSGMVLLQEVYNSFGNSAAIKDQKKLTQVELFPFYVQFKKHVVGHTEVIEVH